jgi:adenine-specific DNA-methyltransferase
MPNNIIISKIGGATLTFDSALKNFQAIIEKIKSPFSVVFWDEDIICMPSNKLDIDLVKKCFKNGFKKINNSGLRVSTGHVVTHRRKQYLQKERSCKKHLPLYWPHNISAFCFNPDKIHQKRDRVMLECEETKKVKICDSVLVFKRISAKEQSKRLEGVIIPKNRTGFFLENHLNFMKVESGDAPPLESMELLLNSSLWDKLFRLINGNTQVSAKEIRLFPIPDNVESLKDLVGIGRSIDQVEKIIHKMYHLSQQESDYVLNREKATT